MRADRRLPRARRRLDRRSPPAELLGLMRGAAPVSAGASGELERLIAAIDERPGGAGAPRRRTATRARRSPRCARSTARPARRCRRISTSSATACSTASTSPSRYALELPDALLRAIRIAVDGAGVDGPTSTTQIAEHPRARCPRSTSAEFDELLGEARLHVPAARRARRLQRHLGVGHHAPRRARGRPPARGDGPHRTTPSTSSTPASTRCARCVTGAGGPSADELAARAEYRATHSAKDAPPIARPAAAAAARPVGPAAAASPG